MVEMNIKDYPVLVLFGGWGREQIILRMHSAGCQVAAVITPYRVSAKLETSIEHVRQSGIRVVACEKANLQSILSEFSHCVLLSVGFPYLLSMEILQKFIVCLNVHPTLLPRYRGPSSGSYILIDNEKESGSTVHVIDEGMDTGPIVLQRKVSLTRFDTIRSLQKKVYSIEPQLVLDALALLREPGFHPTPQDEANATVYSKKRKPEDSEVDPNKTVLQLFDCIRACDSDEFPAFFYLEGQKVCIRLWRLERPESDDPQSL